MAPFDRSDEAADRRLAQIDDMIERRKREIRALEALRAVPDLFDDVLRQIEELNVHVKEVRAIEASGQANSHVETRPTDETLVQHIKATIPEGQKARIATILARLKANKVPASRRDVERVLRNGVEFEAAARGWWAVRDLSKVPF